ncbi:MAG: NAD(P)/FAD-dependent oxidoreductase [Planctomycetota bacterium]|jgi:nitrite reductase (NADH) large subunit
MPNSYVIIGAGPAGVAAASAAREVDPRGRILLLSGEGLPFYSRIRLPEYLGGKVEREKLVIRAPDWFEARSIELRLGTRAIAVDPDAGKVSIDGGKPVAFDAALLATGARASVPPFPGRDLPGVITIRTVEDTEALRDAASGAERIVAIGGGVLGLEMAAALRSLGPAVTVVEVFPWLLPRQLDRAGGEVLQRLLEARGLDFRLDAKVASLEGSGTVRCVRLASGEEIGTAGVLVSAGIVPETSLAAEAGIEVNRGIVIDDRGATSAEGIFAAGDCAEHGGRVYGIWPASEAQGKVAGTNMAGGDAHYGGTVMSHVLKVTGIDVFSMGEIDADGKHDSEVEKGDIAYRKLVKDDSGALIGAVLVGDLTDRGKIAAAIRDGAPNI